MIHDAVPRRWAEPTAEPVEGEEPPPHGDLAALLPEPAHEPTPFWQSAPVPPNALADLPAAPMQAVSADPAAAPPAPPPAAAPAAPYAGEAPVGAAWPSSAPAIATSTSSVSGRIGGAGYDGGHLIGTLFGGAGERINLVPQLASVNRGEFRAMEKEWADALLAGKSVRVEVSPVYGQGSVPTKIGVVYWMDGLKFERKFNNSLGG